MASSLPDLLHESCDVGHRCHLWLDTNAQTKPPPTFRLRTIRNNWKPHHLFEQHLSAYGLLAFSKLTSTREKFILDPSLLTALVDRWRPETHTFHLRCGELTPTLKDVSFITALPISGDPLVPAAYSSTWPQDVADRLGVPVPVGNRSGGRPRGVPVNWLMAHFLELPAAPSAITLRKHLFAYVLYLFAMMFPSTHGDVVLPGLIKIAEEIVDTPLPPNNTYSFGSAMLAHTYRGLCDGTGRITSTTKGHVLAVSYEFLQLWSWEYLPVGRPEIVDDIHPYNLGQGEYGPLTWGSRWTHATKRWATNVVRGCYPEYHQQFELLEESSITWNPWTIAHMESVWGIQPITADCTRDFGFWMTRCNLLFMWMVEPYNPERVMRQFGLFQEVPPPLPRRVDDRTHALDNKGMNCFDWSVHNASWIETWIDCAASDVVLEERPYNPNVSTAYNQWYRNSTRTLLTGPPPTRDEQSYGGIERSAAYHRDATINDFTQIAQDAEAAMRMRNMNSDDGKSLIRRIYDTAMKGIRRFGCARDNDVVTRAYDMPEPRSSRPSLARTTQPRTSATTTTTTTPSYARQDSSLLHRSQSGQRSQRHATIQEDTIFPHISPYGGRYSYSQGESSQRYNTTEEEIDPDWDDMGAGVGYNMAPPQGREQIQGGQNTTQRTLDIVQDFFGYDVTNPHSSLIPPGPESQDVIRTPSPPQETQTQEEEQRYGFGFREHRGPRERLSPSGPRKRVARARRHG